jgi:hypothetical protein
VILNFASAQNTIKIRKSDTTFNAFYYSKAISSCKYSNIFHKGQKGRLIYSTKCRSYYLFHEDGSVFYFNEKRNFRKVKKQCENVDWSILNNINGKYYITGNDVLIFPYTFTATGEKVLGSTSLNGKYFLDHLSMNSGSNKRVMIKLK